MCSRLFYMTLLVAGCDDKPASEPGPATVLDADRDGFSADEGCDDSSPAVSPEAAEFCDSLDNDCDDSTDEDTVDASTWYLERDSDGYDTPGCSRLEAARHVCSCRPDSPSKTLRMSANA